MHLISRGLHDMVLYAAFLFTSRAATAFLAISEQWVSKLVSKNCLIT